MSSDPIELAITETTEADLGFVIDAGSDADAQRFVPVALILSVLRAEWRRCGLR